MKNTPKNIAIEKLFPFEGHPFKVQDNEEMNTLIESIQEQGILSPLIVRPKENTADEYEIVSGHRQQSAPRTYFTIGESLRLQAESRSITTSRETL